MTICGNSVMIWAKSRLAIFAWFFVRKICALWRVSGYQKKVPQTHEFWQKNMMHLGYQKKVPPFELDTREITIQKSSVESRFRVSKKDTIKNGCILSSKFGTSETRQRVPYFRLHFWIRSSKLTLQNAKWICSHFHMPRVLFPGTP